MLRRDRPLVAFENSTDPASMYSFLVDELGFRLALLGEWLRGDPPLSRGRFLDETLGERHSFLAHP